MRLIEKPWKQHKQPCVNMSRHLIQVYSMNICHCKFLFLTCSTPFEEVKEGATSVFFRVICFFSFLVTGFQEWIDDEGEILSSSLQVVSWLFLYLVCPNKYESTLALEQTTWCCLQTYCKRCILCSVQEAIGKRED